MIIYCMAKEGRDWEKCFPNFLIQNKTLTQLNVGVWGNAPKRNLLPRTFYLDHVDKTCSHWTKYVPCAEVPFPCIPKCCFPPSRKVRIRRIHRHFPQQCVTVHICRTCSTSMMVLILSHPGFKACFEGFKPRVFAVPCSLFTPPHHQESPNDDLCLFL